MHNAIPKETLNSVRATLARSYPTLALHDDDGTSYIEGVIQLEHEGLCFESFLVHIDLPEGYPYELPRAFEIGGRIPRNPDHHVNRDGSLCLGVPEELWLQMQGDFEIGPFIKRALTPFLIGTSEKLRSGRWPGIERPHGATGIRQFYSTYIDSSSPLHIKSLLRLLQKREPAKVIGSVLAAAGGY